MAGHGELPVHMPPLVEWPEVRWAAGGRHGGTVEQMPADMRQGMGPTLTTRWRAAGPPGTQSDGPGRLGPARRVSGCQEDFVAAESRETASQPPRGLLKGFQCLLLQAT